MDYINQKEIDGKIYTAWCDSSNPALQYIECEGEYYPCRLKTVWNDNNLIINLCQ